MATLAPDDTSSILAFLIEAAREAGAIAMGFFREGRETVAEVHSKPGGSPVTDADYAVDRFLHDRLRPALPEAGWLSEETADSPERLGCRDVWVVDPIDGTRAFVGGLTTWAVSIALTSRDRPAVGVVYLPATDQLYHAVRGGGAYRDGVRLAVSTRTDLAGARLAGPENYVRPFVERGRLTYVEKVPSLACRMVRVAEGTYEIGIASSGANDWDLAAADLILEEAGGTMTDAKGARLSYNRAVPKHPPLFASSDALHEAVLALTKGTKAG